LATFAVSRRETWVEPALQTHVSHLETGNAGEFGVSPRQTGVVSPLAFDALREAALDRASLSLPATK
jgi:hypothetical protein